MGEEFGTIYDQYVSRIYRFIYLKVSSHEVAEDLCSEVFTHTFKEFRKTEIRNIQAFLYQVARNKVVDHYRGKGKHRLVSLDDQAEVVDSGVGVGQAMVNLDMDMVRKALATLSDEWQNLVIWRYIDEFSIPEIANLSGKSEGNVRVSLHRALRTLKEKMHAMEGVGV